MTDSQCDRREVTVNRLLRALAHEDRRTMLAELNAHDGAAIGIDALTDRVESVPETELYHHHLPVLADAGLVRFEKTRGRVEYTPSERADAILEVLDGPSE